MAKQHLVDYDLKLNYIPIKCNNTSVINLTKNVALNSHVKHIDIRQYFLRGCVEKSDVIFEYVNTKNQLVDIFTKLLSIKLFHKICRELGILDPSCFE